MNPLLLDGNFKTLFHATSHFEHEMLFYIRAMALLARTQYILNEHSYFYAPAFSRGLSDIFIL